MKCGLFVIALWLSRLYGIIAVCSEVKNTYALNIFVLTDLSLNRSPCNLPDLDTFIIKDVDGTSVSANLSWIFASDSFDIIHKVRQINSSLCDVLIIDTVQTIYLHASAELQTTDILVLQWPSRNIVWNTIAPISMPSSCDDVIFGKEKRKTTDRYNVTENWRMSSLIASIIQRIITEQLYVLIQNIPESNIHFEESKLDTISSKYAIYHTLPSEVNAGFWNWTSRTSTHVNTSDWCVIICENACINTSLNEVHTFRKKADTGLRHFSKWLIFADDEFRPLAEYAFADIANVAFVSLSDNGNGKCNRHLILRDIIGVTLQQLSCVIKKSPRINLKSTFGVLFQINKEKILNRDPSLRVDTLPWNEHQRRFAFVEYFNERNCSILQTHTVFPNVLYGFNNRQLIVGTLPWFSFTQKIEINGTTEYRGFCMDILKELSRTLNFSYRIIEPADGQWGSRGKDNKWSGLVGQLQRQEIDMVAANLNVDIGREEVMDFTIPFYYTFITGLYQKPDLNQEKWKTFIKPFRYQIYIALSCVLPFACGVLFVLEKSNAFYKRDTTDAVCQPTVAEYFFHLFGAILCQGHTDTPESITGRTFMSLFWLFSIILTALYSGTLISFLAVTKERIPFSSFDELLNQDEYKWGSLGGSIYITSFSESGVGTIQNVWTGIKGFNESDPSFLSADHNEHVRKVKDGGYVFIAGWNDLTDLGCDLLTIEQILYQNYYAFGLQTNSPYNELISRSLASISENGLQKVWEKKWTTDKEMCGESVKAESKQLTLIDIQSAFYLLGLGILLSTTVLIIETVIYHCYRCIHRTKTDVHECED